MGIYSKLIGRIFPILAPVEMKPACNMPHPHLDLLAHVDLVAL